MLWLFSLACSADWAPAPGAYYKALAPSVEILEPSSGDTLTLGVPVQVSGLVSDPDDALGELSLTLVSDLDGELATGTPTTQGAFSLSATLSEGVHTLQVIAVDPASNRGQASVQVEQLSNQPPTLPELAISPSDPVNGESLRLEVLADAEDPEGQPLQIGLRWYADGAERAEYQDLYDIPEGVTELGQTWQVVMDVSDGELSVQADATVAIENSGPVVNVALDPAAPTSQDRVRCDYEAFDPDGDEVTSISARWLVDGVDSGSADSRLGPLERGVTLACEVSATSSEETVRRAEAVIANAPPVVESVSLSGAPVDESGALTCSAVASDPEGDAVSLRLDWYVNGSLVDSGEYLDGADFDRGNEVWCAATANDGLDDSAPVESEHTFVLNSPPSKPEVQLQPQEAYAGDTLTCAVLTSSVDLDPADVLTETFVWKVNGTNQGVNTQTFDTTGLSGGDTVWCKLKVSDGSDLVSDFDELDLESALSGGYAPADADVRLRGSHTKAAFGSTVVALGDVDGDSGDDLLVAGEGYDNGRGAVWFWSSASLSGTLDDDDADAWWEGAAAADGLGTDQGIAAAGDADADGLADLLLGAPTAAGGGTQRGVVYLLSSGDAGSWGSGGSVSDDAALVISGSADKDLLGDGLGSADVDGDGVSDLLIAAAYEDSAASAAGAVYVFLSGSGLAGSLGAQDADYEILGAAEKDRLGFNAVRALGDVDGDGNDDLLLGAYNADSGAGAAYLLEGSSLSSGSVSSLAQATFTGAAGENLGISGASLQDLDGDGADELLLGARTASVDGSSAGGVYFFFGGSGLSGTLASSGADASWGSSGADDRLGWDLAVGDVDGDGVQDWTSGAYATDSPNNSGTLWLISGAGYTAWTTGLHMDDSAKAWVQGSAGGSYTGRAPAILGDLDGDGSAEWVVGSEGIKRGSTTRAGEVGIFFGP